MNQCSSLTSFYFILSHQEKQFSFVFLMFCRFCFCYLIKICFCSTFRRFSLPSPCISVKVFCTIRGFISLRMKTKYVCRGVFGPYDSNRAMRTNIFLVKFYIWWREKVPIIFSCVSRVFVTFRCFGDFRFLLQNKAILTIFNRN